MISCKKDFRYYLEQDRLAMRKSSKCPHLFGDECWKYIRCLRWLEYCSTMHGIKKILYFPAVAFGRWRFHHLGILCGFSIPLNAFEEGLSIAHYPGVIVNENAKIGRNCSINQGVTIGATNGSPEAPTIGNNCYIGTGACILGEITIVDDVAIGANAVVVKSILESDTTWGGIPAKKISDKNSHCHMSPLLKLGDRNQNV